MRRALLVMLLVGGCAQLQGVMGGGGVPRPSPPRVVVGGVVLAAAPSPTDVARYLCPRVAPAPVCMILGGPGQLIFAFDVNLDVTNTNNIPLPVVEALVGFTAYPGQNGSRLGSVCLHMCEDPRACPQGQAGACGSGGGPEIRTVNDFAGAAAGFLVNVATGQAHLDNLRLRTIPAGGTVRVTFRLEVNAPQLLDLVVKFANAAMSAIQRGSAPQLSIPYSLEGSVWVSVQSFGKLAAGFGPVQGTFDIR
jgi:hypothetical protein